MINLSMVGLFALLIAFIAALASVLVLVAGELMGKNAPEDS